MWAEWDPQGSGLAHPQILLASLWFRGPLGMAGSAQRAEESLLLNCLVPVCPQAPSIAGILHPFPVFLFRVQQDSAGQITWEIHIASDYLRMDRPGGGD